MGNNKTVCLLLYLLFSSTFLFAQSKGEAIPYAHAHNDYEKIGRRDYQDAVANGFVSVEIDVFPLGDQLKVAHLPLFLKARKNLEQRYIQPLYQQLILEGQSLYAASSQRLILMIDVKRNASKAYRLIRALAQQYDPLFAQWDATGELIKDGPVELLISGAKPYADLLADSIRYMRIDGGFGDIASEKYDARFAPRVSSSYRSHFKWRGRGRMPEKELHLLKKLVAQAQADHRQIRFWAMPNNKKVWKTLLDAGVDWLNVDKIKKLRKFHQQKKE